VKQQQYINTYIIGSICAGQNKAEAIISPYCNSDAMHEHLKQISKATMPGRFAVVVMDQAGWHKNKDIYDMPNVQPLFLPPASPELNPMEQVWRWLKDHFLSNRTYNTYQDIEKSSCKAWNFFAKTKELIQRICLPDWANLNG